MWWIRFACHGCTGSLHWAYFVALLHILLLNVVRPNIITFCKCISQRTLPRSQWFQKDKEKKKIRTKKVFKELDLLSDQGEFHILLSKNNSAPRSLACDVNTNLSLLLSLKLLITHSSISLWLLQTNSLLGISR